ncbi:type VI secretion system Vgr family protein [Moritella sp. 28]|uniref:type VI secretion system Vgr family protein n=1 Tax=Moritella sp. 28 TaxID=2746232 RepID=UPI001BA8198B|nr:type VI secretion system tip protein TssI/VgrG [Moritella sp. 28]QUM85215.1 type VI secretion system tip protein VgrG [Moritella sp. 28]
MAAATQQHSMMKITTPLGGDALHITSLSMQESMSCLYEMDASVYSVGNEIDLQALLGQSVTIEVSANSNGNVQTRFLNGIVTSVSGGETAQQKSDSQFNVYNYEIKISPQFWLSTMRSNCRIFQDVSMLDIATTIFGDHNVTFVDNSGKAFLPYEYCVQYHETDYDFLQRLFSQEGIFFYFTQTNGSNTLVLADVGTPHTACAENPLHQTDIIIATPHVSGWNNVVAVKHGKVSLRAINFEQPLLNLDGISGTTDFPGHDSLELFEYESGNIKAGQSTLTAKSYLDQLQAEKQKYVAISDYLTIACGNTIQFSKHNTDALINKDLLVIESDLILRQGSQHDRSSSAGIEIYNEFHCVPITASYRPNTKVQKPLIRGVQTAIVTGAASDEIYVDSYGRIKVKFYWDRLGTSDENSSCWIRVSQNWAGKNWGAFFYPRVGQEVLVSFLDGDASQPIVIGAIYNGDQMPANPLPANKTQSGIRTHSTTTNGNANCNELIFEDKIGSELLGFRAEKDHQLVVVNNQTDTVGNDRTTTVTNNDTLTVTNDQTQTVNNDRNSKIANNDTLDVGNILKLKAATEIKLEVGSASLLMKSDGTIKLSGVNIEISGTNVKVKGSATNIEGSMVVVKGSVVKIN